MANLASSAPSTRGRRTRYIFPIVVLLLVIGGLISVKFAQISSLIAMGKAGQKAGPPPETVSVALAEEQVWEGALSAVGSIAAARGVSVSNDAPGVVSRINFESGAQVTAGQILVELDTSVERAQLASSQARKDLALLTVTRSRSLAKSNTIPLSQVDGDEAQLKASTTDFTALQAQIERKIVRAPFAGRLGIRAVNLGQYLNPGTTLTVLEAIESVYVDFALPQQLLAEIKVGMPVRVNIEGADGVDGGLPSDGIVAAVDPTVDAATRTIKVRASVPNKQERLRPGMFAEVSVVLPKRGSVVAIPQTAVVHASYGDSVFVVEDAKVRQQFVRLGDARGDFVTVVDGVKAGQRVVSAGAFKLRNGSGITIVPDVKPAPQLNPQPENH